MKKVIVIATLIATALFSGNISAFAQEEEKELPLCAKEALILSGDITHEVLSGVISMAIQPCIAEGMKTELIISSDGGDVSPAIAMYDSVTLLGDRKNLKTIGIGMVASSAVIAFLSGGEREITPNAQIYLHRISANLSGTYTSSDITDKQNMIEGMDDAYARIVAKETKLSVEQVHEFMSKGMLFNAEDAVKYGFSHKIVGK